MSYKNKPKPQIDITLLVDSSIIINNPGGTPFLNNLQKIIRKHVFLFFWSEFNIDPKYITPYNLN